MKCQKRKVRKANRCKSIKACAVGLAKIAAAMANGGSLGGVKVVGEKGWQALHAKPTKGSLGKGIWEVIHITQVKLFDISIVDIF